MHLDILGKEDGRNMGESEVGAWNQLEEWAWEREGTGRCPRTMLKLMLQTVVCYNSILTNNPVEELPLPTMRR